MRTEGSAYSSCSGIRASIQERSEAAVRQVTAGREEDFARYASHSTWSLTLSPVQEGQKGGSNKSLLNRKRVSLGRRLDLPI